MNLEDQLRGDQSGAGSARLTERIQVEEVESAPLLEDGRRASGISDPYGELKTRGSAGRDPEARAVAVLEPGVARPATREVTESVAAASSTRRARRSPRSIANA